MARASQPVNLGFVAKPGTPANMGKMPMRRLGHIASGSAAGSLHRCTRLSHRYHTGMRCFIAIELPQAVHDRIGRLQEQLRSRIRGVGWSRTEQIHLTLKFLGEVPDTHLPRVIDAASAVAGRFAPMDLTVAGTGCFPPHGAARVLWVGVAPPPPELTGCAEACEQAMAALGFPPENRPYHPHLTLGRVKGFDAGRQARAAIEQVAHFNAGAFTATELVLFQSVLQRTGPIYTPMARLPLGG